MLQITIPLEKQFDKGITPVCLWNKNQDFFAGLINIKPYYTGMNAINRFQASILAGAHPQVLEVGPSVHTFDNQHRLFCADLYNNAFFTDGQQVTYLGTDGSTVVSPPGIPLSNCIHNCNGQLIAGGILDGTNGMDKNGICWSKIGAADFTVDEMNTAGFRSLADCGEVLGVYSLGRLHVPIVLCSDRCIELIPAERTFGRRDIGNTGPRDIWCSCLAGAEVYYIDDKGNLWQVANDTTTLMNRIQSKNLGYSDLFLNKTILGMFFAKRTEELFIPVLEDGLTYVLNKLGMYSINGLIYGISEVETQAYYCKEQPNLTDAIMIDSIRDFKDPGMKTITEVSVGADTVDDLFVSVGTRVDIKQPFVQSQWYQMNEFMAAKPFIAGLEFQLSFKIPNYTESRTFAPDWMNLQYIKNDKRFNRGHNFSQNNQG